MSDLTVVIQAGGESKRMGKPKALVQFCGAPLICRGLKRLGNIADQLMITTNDQSSLDFLCTNITLNKLELHSDLLAQRGALNGLYTALYYAKHPYVAVVACDMVFPSAPLILAEKAALESSDADVAIPKTSHGYEPFHAVYRRANCLPAILTAIESKQSKATSWFDRVQVREFKTEDVLQADPRGGAFINVNTPEELTELERRILSGEISEIKNLDSAQQPAHDDKICGCGFKIPSNI
jgi:molybdopterin-guanine dinucleotide biosynthesis protein A